MSPGLQSIVALALFVVGLRLSAFFSGNETGFYRLSLPRLGIDAQAGDPTATRLLWFAHRPTQFVATTLVGNNVAHYLVTLAVTQGAVLAFGSGNEWIEVATTLAAAPIIFLFGDLLPKNVYYRAPLAQMRGQVVWFRIFYWLAWPCSAPLVLLSRGLERLLGRRRIAQEILPGRGRFLQMISHGHREGLLTQAQSTMATGVLAIAAQPVSESMTPSSRVLGVSESSSPAQVYEFARRFGTPTVVLHAAESGSSDSPRWTAYCRIGESRVAPEASAMHRRPLAQVPLQATKLEALSILFEQGATYGAVVDAAGHTLGTVSQRGLVEQLFRPSQRPVLPAAEA